ncbi:MAG TPA: phosphoribosyltransferase [Acidimicrobiia bacterium]|nr:phosphoribosyltransferase [Acidimicrobiia bacterium]
MNFVTYSDLARDTRALARKLPRDTYLVLGVPRSGMIPASIVAQELGCHLGDVGTYARTRTFMAPGKRMTWTPDPAGPIVVVDDSLFRGSTMADATAPLAGMNILRAAVYVAPGKEDAVDVYARAVAAPRLFEWNWLGSSLLERSLCDMDGILCEDSAVYDDDSEAYAESLRLAKPLFVPRRKIGAIVTARLERWRTLTQVWLDVHRISVGRLVMAPFPTANARRRHGNAKWKASVYETAKDSLVFVESSVRQAREIAELTGRDVLCPGVGRLFR